MRTLSVLVFISFFSMVLPAHAQLDIEDGTPVQYSMILKVSDEFTDPPLTPLALQYGLAYTPTRLYPPEMKKIADAFLTRIEEAGVLKNHIGPLGPPEPTSLGDMTLGKALSVKESPKWKEIGDYFLNVAGHPQLQFKEGVVMQEGDTFLYDGDLILAKDTVMTQDLNTGEWVTDVVANTQDFEADAAGLIFTETWNYDDKKGRFDKGVHFLALNYPAYDALTGEIRGYRAMLNLRAGKFRSKYQNSDGLVKENMESIVLMTSGQYPDEDASHTDRLFRSPGASYYMEPSDRIEMIMKLGEGVRSGKLRVAEFNPIDFSIDEPKFVASKEFFDAMMSYDTVQSQDLMTGEFTTIIIPQEDKISDIIGFTFFEDWYIDPETLGFYKKVKGVVPLKLKLDDEDGSVRGVMSATGHIILLNP